MGMVVDAIIATLALGLLGSAFALLLYFAFTKLAVKTDPKLELVLLQLPGSNCGACGFTGCLGLAENIVAEKAEVTGCLAGGQAVAEKLAKALGISIDPVKDQVAFIACRAGRKIARTKYRFEGVQNCQAAYLLFGGDKACQYGCLGYGSCVTACPFDAIDMTDDFLAVVNPEKCKSCQKCVKACPRQLIQMVPKSQTVLVACRNHEKARRAKDNCGIACIACKICEKNCPAQAIMVRDNLAVIDYDKCTQCGICVEKCPQKTIIIMAGQTAQAKITAETAPATSG
jgi:electron transport complex protein RnfB